MDPNDSGDADITTWSYDAATGLMTQKRYADDYGPDYDYTVDGRLSRRTWARSISASRIYADYTYFDTSGANTGELKKVDYSDADTIDVEYTYTRTGQISTVSDATGSRTLTYDQFGNPAKETFASGSMFYDRVITYDYDYQVGYTPPGGGGMQVFQFVGLADLQIGTNADPDADYQATYTYDADTARMTKVTGSGLPSGGANYTYDPNSALVQQIEFKQSTTVKARVTRTYEANRNLLASIQNDELVTSPGTPTTVSKYAYRYDDLGRRSDVVYTGNAFTGGSGDHLDLWGYNARNELTGSDRYAGTDPDSPGSAVAAQNRAYTYDAIGNRTKSKTGTDPNEYYCANNLNQYTTIDDTSNCPPTGADETPTYDLDGNLETDGGKIGSSTGRSFTWDGENRLIRVEPASPGSGDIKVEFGYDYLGRRIEKTVTEWDPNTSGWSSTPSSHLRWIYYQWQPLLEMENPGGAGFQPVKKYAWGLDLAGSGDNPTIDGVAGIGGLLAVRDVGLSKSYVYFYDGNGNAGQLVSLSDGSTVAKYEYDAYGNVTASAGSYTATNTMTFSTKPWDDETGLGNWGMRYYDPEKGRWVSRDPIGEDGGLNLYQMVANAPNRFVDPSGLSIPALPEGEGLSPRPFGIPDFGPLPPEPGIAGPLGSQLAPLPPVGAMGRPICPDIGGTGDCAPDEYDILTGAVDIFCHIGKRKVAPPSGGRPTDGYCRDAKTKLAARNACAQAREAINTQCFRGGDEIHQELEKKERDLYDKQKNIYTTYCNDDGTAKNPVPKPVPAPRPGTERVPFSDPLFAPPRLDFKFYLIPGPVAPGTLIGPLLNFLGNGCKCAPAPVVRGLATAA